MTERSERVRKRVGGDRLLWVRVGHPYSASGALLLSGGGRGRDGPTLVRGALRLPNVGAVLCCVLPNISHHCSPGPRIPSPLSKPSSTSEHRQIHAVPSPPR